MVSADKPVITVISITNVAQAKCVAMAATVCQCAQLRCLLPDHHTVVTTGTATHCRESLAVQMVSADKVVTTVSTITNVAQAKCVAMAATVCQCAQPRSLLPFQAIQLFGPEVLLPLL